MEDITKKSDAKEDEVVVVEEAKAVASVMLQEDAEHLAKGLKESDRHMAVILEETKEHTENNLKESERHAAALSETAAALAGAHNENDKQHREKDQTIKWMGGGYSTEADPEKKP